MKKDLKIILLFLFVVARGYTQGPVNDTIVLSKSETNIVAPRFNNGYKSFCEKVANLYRSLNITLHKDIGYSSSFEITINKYGKVTSVKYLTGTPNMFHKIEDTLVFWMNNLPSWKPAYDLNKKHVINNYIITIDVFINTDYDKKNISIVLEGRKSRTLYKYDEKY